MNNSPDRKTKSLQSIKVIFTSGAKIPDKAFDSFKDLLNPRCLFIEGFACTERGAITNNFFGRISGSCGKVLPYVEVQVIDDNRNPLGPNEDGVILTRNCIPWEGYYKDEEATKEVYDKETHWYNTGDLGHFDDNGNLFIVDRINAIMKSISHDISPTEIEMHITKLQGVSEVCVVGIPDILTFNIPAALVVRTVGSQICEEDILKHVSEAMPYYKHLRGGVYFVDELPITNSGKVLRRKARSIVEEIYKARFGVELE